MRISSSWRVIMVGVLLASLGLFAFPGLALAANHETGSAHGAGYGCVYTVRRGDTLTWIAARYGVSVWSLARANGIRNINRIYVGQRLTIPGCYPPAPPPYPPYPPPPPYPPYPPPPPPPAPSCAIVPVMGFGQIWNYNAAVRAALGCAKAAEYSIDATQQRFQKATIFWRGDAGVFWVLWKNGTWAEYSTGSWYDVAGQFGWPIEAPVYVKISVQDFDGGRMLWTATLGFYVLYNNGTYQYLN